MSTLSERITRAKDIAVAREGDIRIKELISAMTLLADAKLGPSSPYPLFASVNCPNRGWGLYMMGRHIGELQKLDDDALAAEVAGWIQGAIESRFLTLSHPPRG